MAKSIDKIQLPTLNEKRRESKKVLTILTIKWLNIIIETEKETNYQITYEEMQLFLIEELYRNQQRIVNEVIGPEINF